MHRMRTITSRLEAGRGNVCKLSRSYAYTTANSLPASSKPFSTTSTIEKEDLAKLSTFSARSGLALSQPTLIEALTHRSYKDSLTHIQSDRYQVLGERVLTFFVTEYLFAKYPTLPAHALASSSEAFAGPYTLANVGRNIGLPFVMRSGMPATEKDRESLILSKIVHALIGALYTEKGSKAAKEFQPQSSPSEYFEDRPKASTRFKAIEGNWPSIVYPVFIVGIYSGVEKIGEGFGSSWLWPRQG
ncbi:ribonuclease III domain-containing protein [Chytridium lagenaria]|nr:ribonuclease III domain-containing protein [Chytridium lagenaria]